MELNLKKYHDEMVQELQKLVSYKTVLDTPVENGPFGKGNKECLEYVLSLCARLGMKVKNLDGYCGYAEVGEGEEIFAIISHLDVVPEGEGWEYPPYQATIVDQVMTGRGVWDDKGPAVVSIYTIKALMDAQFVFKKRVRLIFGCNEETGSLCVEHYLKKEGQITYGFTPDADFPVIFGEKTINNITIEGKAQNKGNLTLQSIDAGEAFNAVISKATFNIQYGCQRCKQKLLDDLTIAFQNLHIVWHYNDQSEEQVLQIIVIGKAAHGSLPMLGVNAASYGIYALSQTELDNSFVQWYAKYIGLEYDGKRLGCYATDQYGDIAVNVGIVKYHQGTYFVGINCRLPFNITSQEVIQAMKKTLQDENVTIQLPYDSKGFLIQEDSLMIQTMVKAYQQVTKDYTSKPKCIAGGTYARHFHNCVGFGASLPFSPEENIHSANERLKLELMDIWLEIYVLAVQKLLTNVHFN